MFGPDLLVAPVINEDTFRNILFPSGEWTSLWDGKTVSGPAKLKISAPLDMIPVYLKPGAMMPVQLNRELRFGESMTNNSVNVLIVTPPTGNENVSLLNAQGEAARVTVQPKVGGFAWTLENLPETSCVLIYGRANASTIEVDGKVLPKLTASEFGSRPAGWKVDPSRKRLIIRLPSAEGWSNRPTREVQVSFGSSAA